MSKSDSLELAIVHFAFFTLFPGFFFYHSALGKGAIGPIFLGYFSPISLAFMPILLTLYILKIRQSKRFITRTDFAFFAFLLYFFFVVALNFAFGANHEVVKDHLASILHFAVVFIMFRIADFGSKKSKWISFICLIGMTAVIFYLSVDGFLYLKEQGASSDSENVATYQGFARSYLVTFLVLLPFINTATLRLLIYFICVPALFVNGARSELVALIASIALTEIFYAKHRFPMLILVLALASIYAFYSNYLITLLPNNRVLELMDLSQSRSWDDRKLLFTHALESITAHPLLGDYGSYVANGGAGSYAHNIFSAWVDLGFFGFVYLVCMLVLPVCSLSIDAIFRKAKVKPEELMLAFSLLFVTLLLLFTAKNFTYMLIAAAMGRYAHYRMDVR